MFGFDDEIVIAAAVGLILGAGIGYGICHYRNKAKQEKKSKVSSNNEHIGALVTQMLNAAQNDPALQQQLAAAAAGLQANPAQFQQLMQVLQANQAAPQAPANAAPAQPAPQVEAPAQPQQPAQEQNQEQQQNNAA